MMGEEILRKIFLEAREAEDKALELAEKKCPPDISDDKSKEYKKEYCGILWKQLLKELCIKYGITKDHLEDIIKEGNLRGW